MDACMNAPGTAIGNWTWRFTREQLDADLADRCRRLAVMSGRVFRSRYFSSAA